MHVLDETVTKTGKEDVDDENSFDSLRVFPNLIFEDNLSVDLSSSTVHDQSNTEDEIRLGQRQQQES